MLKLVCKNCRETFKSKRVKNLCAKCKYLKAIGKWEEYAQRRK